MVDNQVNQIAKLEFSVKPLENYKEVAPLKVKKVQRNDLTVIEWGGAKY